jgi:hypothetical protein
MKDSGNDSVPHFVLRELDILRQLKDVEGVI